MGIESRTETPRSKSLIRRTVDIFRTAPVYESVVVSSIASIPLNIYADNSLFVAIRLASAASFLLITKKQFNYKKRLEESMRRHGYQEKIMELSVREWCSRQTARVVAEDYGKLSEYESLCQRKKKTMKNKFIPHF